MKRASFIKFKNLFQTHENILKPPPLRENSDTYGPKQSLVSLKKNLSLILKPERYGYWTIVTASVLQILTFLQFLYFGTNSFINEFVFRCLTKPFIYMVVSR